MKKLDLRTMAIMLAVFALGYGVCLAMPITRAGTGDSLIVDRLLVTDYIELSPGVRLYGFDGKLFCSGNIEANGFIWARDSDIIASRDVIFLENLKRDATIIIDPSCNLQNVTLDGNNTISNGTLIKNLNADTLDGYSAEEFQLKAP